MALLAACSGTSGDSAEIEAGIRIVSPDNGDWFDIGEDVSLGGSLASGGRFRRVDDGHLGGGRLDGGGQSSTHQ